LKLGEVFLLRAALQVGSVDFEAEHSTSCFRRLLLNGGLVVIFRGQRQYFYLVKYPLSFSRIVFPLLDLPFNSMTKLNYIIDTVRVSTGVIISAPSRDMTMLLLHRLLRAE